MYKILALQALNQALNMNLAKTIKISLWSLSSILELCLRDFYKSSVLFFLILESWRETVPHHWTTMRRGLSPRTLNSGEPLRTYHACKSMH